MEPLKQNRVYIRKVGSTHDALILPKQNRVYLRKVGSTHDAQTLASRLKKFAKNYKGYEQCPVLHSSYQKHFGMKSKNGQG